MDKNKTSLLIQHFTKNISLTVEEIEIIEFYFQQKKVKKKDFILRAGEIYRYSTFVLKGCFIIYFFDEEGKKHITQIGQEEAWVGDIASFIAQQPSDFYTEALENSEVCYISKAKLELLYAKVPKLERHFRLLIQNAYVASQNKANTRISVGAKQRYQTLIQKFPNIEQRVPQYIIASFLGIRPEYLSRIKNKN